MTNIEAKKVSRGLGKKFQREFTASHDMISFCFSSSTQGETDECVEQEEETVPKSGSSSSLPSKIFNRVSSKTLTGSLPSLKTVYILCTYF